MCVPAATALNSAAEFGTTAVMTFNDEKLTFPAPAPPLPEPMVDGFEAPTE
jgi:hypothetical protein